MPQLIFTEKAIQGLERCRLFLKQKNPEAAKRATQTISQQFSLLELNPEMGRPLEDIDLRELVIHFGSSGYVALYRFHPEQATVYVLAFRHQKEAGYDRK